MLRPILKDVPAVELARYAAKELLYRTEIDGREIDEVVMGQVVPSVLTPNVAREVSLLPQLPPGVPAYTLNRACASAAQAITNAAYRQKGEIPGPWVESRLHKGCNTTPPPPIASFRRYPGCRQVSLSFPRFDGR